MKFLRAMDFELSEYSEHDVEMGGRMSRSCETLVVVVPLEFYESFLAELFGRCVFQFACLHYSLLLFCFGGLWRGLLHCLVTLENFQFSFFACTVLLKGAYLEQQQQKLSHIHMYTHKLQPYGMATHSLHIS